MTLDREHVARALPGYDVGEEIGRGGWGVVIRAQHRQLGRSVAVKELPRAFAADPGVRRRFVTEARLLATLDHPHIVPIYDYVEEESLCLLVMELLSGGTLWDRLTTDGVSADAACSIVLAACSALHYAHGKGILHRDIKPDNLLFAASGTLKVSDFGIAKVVGGTASMATRTGEVLGTPAYMAPEQALGAELSPATDVYALGTVLYEMLSGRLPFVDDGNAIALLYRHVHEAPTSLADAAPDLPAELVEITMRALAADPAERYENAEDFGVALADAATSALGAGWVQRGGIAVMATGRIGARISGPPHLADTQPRPATPQSPTNTQPAPATVVETAPPPPPSSVGAAPGTEMVTISPEELVPVQDVIADAVAPQLVAPSDAQGAGATSPETVPKRERRSPLVVGLVAIGLLALAAAGVFLFARGGSSRAVPPHRAPGVTATIRVQPHADHVTFGPNGIFVTESTSKRLARIDPAGNTVTQFASLPNPPHAIAASSDALWMTSGDTLMRVPAGTAASQTAATIVPVGTRLAEVATGADAVWATAPQAGRLVRVDPATNRVVATIPIGSNPDSVVVDANGVWVANRLPSGTVTRVDPATNKVVATIPVGDSPDQLAIGEGAVWVANPGSGTVSRIDPATNKVVATISVGGRPKSVVAGAGAVWISETSANQVLRLDPATNKVTDRLAVGRLPESGAVGGGSVWVVNGGDDTVSRIDPGV